MKKMLSVIIVLLMAFTLLSSPNLFADDVQFNLTLSGTDLVVSAPTGGAVTVLHLPTIGRQIDIAPVSFLVSYGRDAHGNLSTIVSPNPDQPSDLDFKVFGHEVTIEKGSIVTATSQDNGQRLKFDPGFVGQVKLDGKVINSSVSLYYGPAVPASKTDQASAAPAPVAPPQHRNELLAAPSAPVEKPADQPPTMATSSTSPAVQLASDFRGQNPGVDLVPLLPGKVFTADEISGLKAKDQVALKQIYWSEPVTPLDPSNGITVAPNEIKFAEVTGEVKVTNSQGKTVEAKIGQAIESNSSYAVGDNSSVALLIGGVDSVRLTSQTTATVTSSLNGNQRTTLINLTQGIVFSKVGRRDGEVQDYRVKTVLGEDVVHGTDFSTALINGRMVTMGVQGVVEVFDANNQLIGTAAPREQHTIAYVSVGGSDPTPINKSQDILTVLATASQINPTVNGLLDQISTSQTLTPEQESYLKKVAIVDLSVPPIEETKYLLTNIHLPLPGQVPQVVAWSPAGPSIPISSTSNLASFSSNPLSVPDPVLPNVMPVGPVTITPRFTTPF